jgi:hypothetical protein
MEHPCKPPPQQQSQKPALRQLQLIKTDALHCEKMVQSINQLSLQPSLGQLLESGLAVTPVDAAGEERRPPMSREEILNIVNGLYAFVFGDGEDDFEDNDFVGPNSPEQREETGGDRESKQFPKQ